MLINPAVVLDTINVFWSTAAATTDSDHLLFGFLRASGLSIHDNNLRQRQAQIASMCQWHVTIKCKDDQAVPYQHQLVKVEKSHKFARLLCLIACLEQ